MIEHAQGTIGNKVQVALGIAIALAFAVALSFAMPAEQAHAAGVSRTKVYADNTNNCVLWARKQVPSLPSGLTYYSGKQKICNLSGSDTPHAGDVAVIRRPNEYGHVAVVMGCSGGKVTIRESNWVKGYITQATGTPSALDITGYFCPGGSGHSGGAQGGGGGTGHDPIGFLDSCSTGPGQITVRGWAFDGDSPSSSIDVHVYVDDTCVGSVRADKASPDVSKVHGVGGAHRFDATLDVPMTGSHTVRAYGINVGPGGNSMLTNAKAVDIPDGSPFGFLDSCSSGYGQIRVCGWALDPNSPSSSIDVHVYVDDTCVGSVRADKASPDVSKVHGVGGAHRFDATLDVPMTGSHTVRAYGINVGPGGNSMLTNAKAVDIKDGNPVGCYDSAQGGRRSVKVRGWAFDRNALGSNLQVHVYIGGPAGSKGAEGRIVTANDNRPDVNNVYGCGNKHGFNASVRTTKTGWQRVYVYAINQGAGTGNPCLGYKTVYIRK